MSLRSQIPKSVADNAFWKFECDAWERAAGCYEEYRKDTVLFVEGLLDAAKVGADSRLLDVACGPGFVSEAAARRGANPVGLDVAVAMVERARARNPGLRFVLGDAHRLPFPEGSFDAVTMNFGIGHLCHPAAVLAEARRVLVPGGRLAFSAWVAEGNAAVAIADAAVAAHAEAVRLPQGPGFYRYGDGELSRQALIAAGFQVDTFRTDTLTASWQTPAADFVFEAELRAGVRTGAVLRAQPRERLEAIRAAIIDGASRFADGEKFTLPIVARVSSARA
jgi:SAM-dependent methyltransferase